MKKKLFIVLAIAIFLMPFYVKADNKFFGYSSEIDKGTIGSTITFKIYGEINNSKQLSGTLEYDPTVLDFDIIAVMFTGGNDIMPYEADIKTISNDSGKLVYELVCDDKTAASGEIGVRVSFKVKSIPKSNKAEVIFTPVQLTDTDDTDKNMNMSVELIDSEVKIATDPSCKCVSNGNKYNSILLYASWAVSGILLISLVAVISKKNTVN